MKMIESINHRLGSPLSLKQCRWAKPTVALAKVGTIRYGVTDNFQDPFALLSYQCQSWSPNVLRTHAGFGFCQFDVLNQLDVEIEFQQRKKPTVDFQRLCNFSRLYQVINDNRFFRKCTHKSPHPAVCSQEHRLHGQRIHAAEYPEPVTEPVDHSRYVGYIACGFFDC